MQKFHLSSVYEWQPVVRNKGIDTPSDIHQTLIGKQCVSALHESEKQRAESVTR